MRIAATLAIVTISLSYLGCSDSQHLLKDEDDGATKEFAIADFLGKYLAEDAAELDDFYAEMLGLGLVFEDHDLKAEQFGEYFSQLDSAAKDTGTVYVLTTINSRLSDEKPNLVISQQPLFKPVDAPLEYLHSRLIARGKENSWQLSEEFSVSYSAGKIESRYKYVLEQGDDSAEAILSSSFIKEGPETLLRTLSIESQNNFAEKFAALQAEENRKDPLADGEWSLRYHLVEEFPKDMRIPRAGTLEEPTD